MTIIIAVIVLAVFFKVVLAKPGYMPLDTYIVVFIVLAEASLRLDTELMTRKIADDYSKSYLDTDLYENFQKGMKNLIQVMEQNKISKDEMPERLSAFYHFITRIHPKTKQSRFAIFNGAYFKKLPKPVNKPEHFVIFLFTAMLLHFNRNAKLDDEIMKKFGDGSW